MTTRKCPQCKKISLRITNVMAVDKKIHWRCNECCFKETTSYDYASSSIIESWRQLKLDEVSE
jgi:transposase-like protein